MDGKQITEAKEQCLFWGHPLAASSLSRNGSHVDVGAYAHEMLLMLAFPHKAKPCFSHRLGCLLLSDVTSVSLM